MNPPPAAKLRADRDVALLPARTEDITVFGASLHTSRENLPADHSLTGRALQLLTDDVAVDLGFTLNLPARAVDAVDRNRSRRGGRDTYLHLYEHSLDEYDPEPRKRSGSSCTPAEVVGQTGRPTDDVLVTASASSPDLPTRAPSQLIRPWEREPIRTRYSRSRAPRPWSTSADRTAPRRPVEPWVR